MSDSIELDPDEGPSPLSPEFVHRARLGILVHGGIDVYRRRVGSDPSPDMMAEADTIRARLADLALPPGTD